MGVVKLNHIRYTFLFTTMFAIYTANLITSDLVVLIIISEEKKICSSSTSVFLQTPVVSTLIVEIQSVPLANELGMSLIILTSMKILQRNLNSTCHDVVKFLTH